MKPNEENLRALWQDAANWKAGCIYNCPEDPRVIVHKRVKWMGYTMNFAHTSAYTVLLLMIAYLTLPTIWLFILPLETGIAAMLATEAIAVIALVFYCKWETERYD